MSATSERTDWGFRGPPESLLRSGGEPRRPFSVVRYWMPGVVFGAVIVIVGCLLAAAVDQWLFIAFASVAGMCAPVGYVVPVKRSLSVAAAVLSVACVALAALLALPWGLYGVLVGAAIWAVTMPVAAIGVFAGIAFRDVARDRWYHARFLP